MIILYNVIAEIIPCVNERYSFEIVGLFVRVPVTLVGCSTHSKFPAIKPVFYR